MPFVNTLSVSAAPEDACSTAEEEILVDFQKLLFPEVFFVKYVCAEDLSGYTTSQIFKSFASEASFNCSVVLNLH